MKNKYFFYLLLSCGKNQGIALLETADKHQTSELVNLLYNLTLNTKTLSPKTRIILKKNKKILSKLFNKKNTDKRNYSIIRNNSAKIYNLIKSAERVINKVV